MGKRVTLAVIGGGFSGAALAAYLLRRGGDAPLDVVVYEPRAEIGWGVAYGDAAHRHVLNVPANRMGLWSDAPEAFLLWARRHGPALGWPSAAAAGPETYLPRRLFGHYLAEELAQAVAVANSHAQGPRLIHRRARVVDLERRGAGYALCLEGGETAAADAVVLASGFRAPAAPFPVKGVSDRFIADPWRDATLSRIGRDESVLIVGTGLTMVDMVYSLAELGHRGRVVALSRRGFLPLIHGVSIPLPPLLTPDDAERGLRHALALFRAALAEGKADWRSGIDSLRPVVDSLWRALPLEDQKRFLRHLSPFWEVHRHRMPAESADLLLKAVGQGRLTLLPGRVQSLDLSGTAPKVSYRRRGQSVNQTENFAWVINCTPPAPAFDPRFDDLPQALARRGLARPHAVGQGYSVSPEGQTRDPDGKPVSGLYVLGPPRRGQAMEATAVPHIRPQLESLSAALLDRVNRALATETHSEGVLRSNVPQAPALTGSGRGRDGSDIDHPETV